MQAGPAKRESPRKRSVSESVSESSASKLPERGREGLGGERERIDEGTRSAAVVPRSFSSVTIFSFSAKLIERKSAINRERKT